MRTSATDVLHEAMAAAVVDAITALKAALNGLPNALLRDLDALHCNTAATDLPPALRDAMAKSVRLASTRLQKDGYGVVDAQR